MDKKIGFIGCGNMGKAILGGLIASGQVLPGQIWVYTPSPDKVAALRDEYGVNAAESAQEVAQVADIVFGAVKPNIMIKVLSEITSSLNKETPWCRLPQALPSTSSPARWATTVRLFAPCQTPRRW